MKQYTWYEANKYVKSLNHAGYTDWRLPTVKELLSVYDYASGEPVIDVQSCYYWSGSTYANSTFYAWGVYMVDGFMANFNKFSDYYVWPVRSGQFDHLGNLIVPGVPEGTERVTDNGDGTFTDNLTRLMWLDIRGGED